MSSPSRAMATIVSVNMGYGHDRAAYALKSLAQGKIIHANDYEGIPKRDRAYWEQGRSLYETVSRFQQLPLIGSKIFDLMDRMQRIAPFYPRRDLSAPNLQLRQTYYAIERFGIGKHLIDQLAKRPRPLVCTFFTPAFAAEIYDYPEDIYCVICDADVSRTWAPLDPKRSRIKYFAPNGRVVERLKLYGIREDQIFFTGFPLPKELLGTNNTTIVQDVKTRLCNLDPKGIFLPRYQKTLELHLGIGACRLSSHRPLTLTYAVGGAGAQRSLGIQLLQSLRHYILRKRICLHLVAGTNKQVASFFSDHIKRLGLERMKGTWVHIDTMPTRDAYFKEFTQLLRSTDILWTKPSELSFYTGLGLPIIMAPSIGSQEVFNRTWLKAIGGGVTQADPRYVNEWLFDWVESGALARLAWNGYIEAPTHGTHRIEDVLLNRHTALEQLPLIV